MGLQLVPVSCPDHVLMIGVEVAGSAAFIDGDRRLDQPGALQPRSRELLVVIACPLPAFLLPFVEMPVFHSKDSCLKGIEPEIDAQNLIVVFPDAAVDPKQLE